MPYVEKAGVETVKEQLDQWKGVMHDRNIDGFNGYACKQKILEVLWHAEKCLENAPRYHGEQDWIVRREEELFGHKIYSNRSTEVTTDDSN